MVLEKMYIKDAVMRRVDIWNLLSQPGNKNCIMGVIVMCLKNLILKFVSSILIVLLCILSFNISGGEYAEAVNMPDVNDINKLDKLLTEVDKIIDNLTTEERNKLESIKQTLNDTNLVKTTQDIIAILNQNGLKTKLETVVNENITFEQAELTLKLIIPLAKGDWDGLKTQLNAIKVKYSSIIQKLKANGITEGLVYNLIVRVNTELMELNRRNEITADNFETILVKVVQNLVTAEEEFKPVKNVMIKAYDKLPVKILGDDTAEIFKPEKASLIVTLIDTHIDESSNPEVSVIKDTFDLARQILKDIYVSKTSVSGGGGDVTPPPLNTEFSAKLEENRENQISVPGTSFKVVIPVGAIEIPANAAVNFRVKEVTGKDAEQLFERVINNEQRAAYKIYGKIYDLEISVEKDGVTTYITSFAKPLAIEFPYEDTSGGVDIEKLIVWRFNDGLNKAEAVGGKADKEKKVIRVTLGGFSKYGVMVFEKSFDDVKTHWAKADIEILASRGVVSGIDGNRFGPELSVTRAEFAVLLVKALNLREEEPISFTDVPTESWFHAEVAKAVKAGIISGYGNGKFKPNLKITREEMAVMINKACQSAGKGLAAGNENVLTNYTDKVQVSAWAKGSLADVINAGIIQGRSETTLAPNAAATRAEASVIIRRLIKLL